MVSIGRCRLHTSLPPCSRHAAPTTFPYTPVKLSAGRQSLRVRNQFTSSAPDTNSSSHAVPFSEPVRPVMLPTGALWILNEFQDKYYSVRGSDFIIHRGESNSTQAKGHKAKHHHGGAKNLPAKAPVKELDPMALLYTALKTNPAALAIYSDTIIDIPAADVEVMQPFQKQAVTSLVWMPQQQEAAGMVHVPGSETEADEDVFVTGSSSPRRTKFVRFTCVAEGCGAVNVKPMNPLAFTQGTAFAQCGKCQVWHLIRDNLELFHQMKGPIYRKSPRITIQDVPASLRPPMEDGQWLDGSTGSSMN